jgi:hypothetical protein
MTNADIALEDKIFRMLVGQGEPKDPNGGAKFMRNIILTTNKPVPKDEKKCDVDGTVAFTVKIDPPDREHLYVIRLCDVAYKYPLYTKTGCTKLGDKVSGWMSTLDGVILHEMM